MKKLLKIALRRAVGGCRRHVLIGDGIQSEDVLKCTMVTERGYFWR